MFIPVITCLSDSLNSVIETNWKFSLYFVFIFLLADLNFSRIEKKGICLKVYFFERIIFRITNELKNDPERCL